ncbi:carboxylesterase/lipase family protein [Paenibacillus sp. NFR01]|uniref:carboxylesterase/lipase family protein n=1 Tax=Paenibacillus sp. NFR01 TaxID=1566279 RepID=UPI0008B13164|nr:carboxylesterase/lipase family protein [Paenibacillus sp. NFR01]SET54964.1 para-nitrobenzyl esterase [Paenibacillus sp. NFR01]
MTEPVATTIYGKVRGLARDGIRLWRGIPFAAPPAGERRFRAPQPPEPWTGVRDALNFSAVCWQPPSSNGIRFGGTLPEYSEDCLYLNVWSPAADGETLPVMVWIHGGTFITGSGSQPMFDGTNMASRGRVVVVTLNYRLGPLGFLHLSPFGEDLCSNAGLLDQIAGLKWVQDNIAAFGGDPARVTVFGESAGSMSIAALLAMPEAKGLFSAAILQSGASQSLSGGQGRHIAEAFLTELELQPDGALDALHTLPVGVILSAAARMVSKVGGDSLALLFQPVLDPATLPLEPLAAVGEGSAAGVSLLIGTNRDEGHFFFRPDREAGSFESGLQALQLMMGIPSLEALAQEYPRNWEGQAQLLTDLLFWGGSIALAECQQPYAPVWMYRYDWAINGHPLLDKAIHAAEIYYVFNNLPLLGQYGVTVTPEMERVALAMLDAWTSFAHTGKPAVDGAEWPPYTAKERATMIFDREPELQVDPDPAKRLLVMAALQSR